MLRKALHDLAREWVSHHTATHALDSRKVNDLQVFECTIFPPHLSVQVCSHNCVPSGWKKEAFIHWLLASVGQVWLRGGYSLAFWVAHVWVPRKFMPASHLKVSENVLGLLIKKGQEWKFCRLGRESAIWVHLCQTAPGVRGRAESIWSATGEVVNMPTLTFLESSHSLWLYKIFLVAFPCATIVHPWQSCVTNASLYRSQTLHFLSPTLWTAWVEWSLFTSIDACCACWCLVIGVESIWFNCFLVFYHTDMLHYIYPVPVNINFIYFHISLFQTMLHWMHYSDFLSSSFLFPCINMEIKNTCLGAGPEAEPLSAHVPLWRPKIRQFGSRVQI